MISLSILSIVSIDLAVNLYQDAELREKIRGRVSVGRVGRSKDYFSGGEANREWAKKILNGGYIILIRHTERDKKWVGGSGLYDLLETELINNNKNPSRLAENDYFANAVCLTEKGKIQAKAISEHLERVGFPIGTVISSPICRARQTAELAFGGYNKLDKVLIHSGIYHENKELRYKNLEDFFNALPIEKTKNTILTAHGNVILRGLFENPSSNNLKIDQGGFIILSRKDGRIKVEHSFILFNDFTKALYEKM